MTYTINMYKIFAILTRTQIRAVKKLLMIVACFFGSAFICNSAISQEPNHSQGPNHFQSERLNSASEHQNAAEIHAQKAFNLRQESKLVVKRYRRKGLLIGGKIGVVSGLIAGSSLGPAGMAGGAAGGGLAGACVGLACGHASGKIRSGLLEKAARAESAKGHQEGEKAKESMMKSAAPWAKTPLPPIKSDPGETFSKNSIHLVEPKEQVTSKLSTPNFESVHQKIEPKKKLTSILPKIDSTSGPKKIEPKEEVASNLPTPNSERVRQKKVKKSVTWTNSDELKEFYKEMPSNSNNVPPSKEDKAHYRNHGPKKHETPTRADRKESGIIPPAGPYNRQDRRVHLKKMGLSVPE